MCDMALALLGVGALIIVFALDRAARWRDMYHDVRHCWERDWRLQQRIIDNLKRENRNERTTSD